MIRLAKALPQAIDRHEDLDRCVQIMERLDRRGESLSREERALLALLEQLVAACDGNVELPAAPPHEVIRRGLRQADLLPVFGSRSVASDVLAGKRESSKAHIRALAEFFHVPAGAFL